MKKLIWIFCLLISSTIQAQIFDFNVKMGIPTSDFRYASESVGIGLGGTLLFPMQETPLYLGGEITYMTHGHTSQEYTQNSGWGSSRDLELTTNNNMLMGNLVMRLIPTQETDLYVTPYLEGFVGFNWLYTRTKLQDVTRDNWDWLLDDDDNDRELIESSIDYSDIALVYGGGVGLMVGRGAMKLNLKCRYLFGAEAEYLDKESVEFDPYYPEVMNFTSKKSPTHMIMPEVGLVFIW